MSIDMGSSIVHWCQYDNMGYEQIFGQQRDFENRLKAYWQIYWAFLQSLRPPLDEMKLEGSKSFNIVKRQIPLQTE